MAERDVETFPSIAEFVATLRRLADALETGESFRIQIAGQRFRVPRDAELSIEHEREGDNEEVELQLRWTPSRDNAQDDDGDETTVTV